MRSQSLACQSANAARWVTPALAMRMSSLPICPMTASRAAREAACSVTSKTAVSTLRPRSRSLQAAASNVSAWRLLRTTMAPASASASAIAKPRPREAPVTSATRPSSENSGMPAMLSVPAVKSDGRFDHGPQFCRDFGHDAEPGMKRRSGLVEQHAQPVDGSVAAQPCRSQERCFPRNVDDIGHQRRGRQLVECEVERRLTGHALARGVDQHRDAIERGMAIVPRQRLDGCSEFLRERLRTHGRTIDEADLPCLLIREAHQHGPGAAAGADDSDRAGVGPPTRIGLQNAVNV